MSTQLTGEHVRWQDLKVRSELDIVLEIAREKGWDDCEIFGYGDMITQPQESMGWKLIPADAYEYSIPPEAVGRLHQIINAGIRVRGVIIADDERRTEPSPAKSRVSLSAIQAGVSRVGQALLGFIRSVRAVGSLIGQALTALIRAVGVIALMVLLVFGLIHFFWPVMIVGFLLVAGSGVSLDPKLVILVDDGKGGTAWISLFTWYD